MNPLEHVKVYEWPEGRCVLSPFSVGLMQKGRCTHDIHGAIIKPLKEYRRQHLIPIV